ncbi:alpha-mannosidase 2-like [Tigriopus californicus]|uniref:alpha-mannosidase 2-like n=1 Tax=Tigriopus californicus TaxID=6832 RepID=UPI0027DA159F|nr:alpha-mannosidase 2-like [Tigriopus californicus]
MIRLGLRQLRLATCWNMDPPIRNNKFVPGHEVRGRHGNGTDLPTLNFDVRFDAMKAFRTHGNSGCTFFGFLGEWVEMREYWNDKMEKRYQKRRKDMWPKVPLKVIIMPHSHNDPGWLKTFEGYFNTATKNILNNAVDKMTKYKDMTFVWTEMAFLSLWYETVHDARKANFHQLVEEGRFEILTGGWVMTDEANVHIFAMVDQLIEGQQWLKNTFNVTPKSSWSVDPFGHGGTFPYVLQEAGVDGMVIMRIHYAWKEWFAREQQGDFLWHQPWDAKGKHDILCHNFPYDIYSIKGSCGPHAQVCLGFNFKNVVGEYNENGANIAINGANVKERAELILDQYGKTGSLVPHNVVLVPLGDDFTYKHDIEWDQQYSNYKILIDFINQGNYNAEISFGTLSDYFEEVRKRTTKFDTLSGDFFVYSDVFSEGRPAYWSGYYTTRPFMKQMSRQVENHLRSAEILYTYSLNKARQEADKEAIHFLEALFVHLTTARRHLALFQHHDAITGTSKQFVMHDYGLKLFEALNLCRKIQRNTLQFLTYSDKKERINGAHLGHDFERSSYKTNQVPVAIDMKRGDAFILVFNPLAQRTEEITTFYVETSAICIVDPKQVNVRYQMNPTWNSTSGFKLDTNFLEVTFKANLEPLSITKFQVKHCHVDIKRREKTQVFCNKCPNRDKPSSPLTLAGLPPGAIQLENSQMVLMFDEVTKLLTSVTNKLTGKKDELNLKFSAYPTAQFRSGAYLFKTDPHMSDYVEVFTQNDLKDVVVMSGPVYSEVTVVYESGENTQSPGSFIHTVRLYHTSDGIKSKGIYIENCFNFGDSNNHNDVDLFMRFETKIRNHEEDNTDENPVFYSDQNGFQMQKRSKVYQIGIEGNSFPITSLAYIEDSKSRLSILVDHAQAAASWMTGWLEVMVDRRSSFDDSRGMGEGVLDNRETIHRYWVTVEAQPPDEAPQPTPDTKLSLPSQLVTTLSRHLNYPAIHYLGYEAQAFRSAPISLLESGPLPCDIHLFNLRTLADPNVPTKPSSQALMILHRQGKDCELTTAQTCSEGSMDLTFKDLNTKEMRQTSLTGTQDRKEALNQLSELEIEPMTLTSVKVSF